MCYGVQIVSDTWNGLKRVSGVYQLSIKQDTNSAISLFVAKVTDYAFMVGMKSYLEEIFWFLRQRHPIIKTALHDTICFNGCTIRKDDQGYISMYMTEYQEAMEYI